MSKQYNFSLSGVFMDEQVYKLCEDSPLINSIVSYLTTELALSEQDKIQIADHWATIDTIAPIDDWNIEGQEQIFNVEKIKIAGKKALIRVGNGQIIQHGQLAISITSDKDLPEFLPATLQLVESFTPNNDGMLLGFGTSEVVKSLIESDAGQLLLLRKTLGKTTSVTDGLMELWNENASVVVYFTLNDFVLSYPQSPVDALDMYTAYIKQLRATCHVYQLLGIDYHIIKGLTNWVKDPFDDSVTYLIQKLKPLEKDFYEEGFNLDSLEAINANSDVETQVTVVDFEDAAAGAVCVIVNVTEGDQSVKKMFYPIRSYTSGETLIALENQLQDKLPNFEANDVKHVFLDENTEKRLLNQIVGGHSKRIAK